MAPEIYYLVTGLIGGIIRGLVGITKSKTFTPEKFKFNWKYFGFSILVSALTGAMTGLIVNGDWRVSLLAGYAGADLLENLYRLKFFQSFKSN